MIRVNSEAILIPDLQDGVAYMAFLIGLLPRRVKFSLVESKVMMLAEALRRAQNFRHAMEICARDDFGQQDN